LFMGTKKLHSTGILLYRDLTTTNRGMFEEDKGQYDDKLDIFGPIGCGALYKRSMLEKIDLGEGEYFDNDYFAYREDDDIAWRGRFAGFKCLFVPKSVVYHVHSATGKVKSPFKIYHTERNRIWNDIKILPWYFVLISIFYTIWRYIGLLYFALRNVEKNTEFSFNKQSKIDLVRVILVAYFDAFKKINIMLKKRTIIQQKRIISSAKIREWFIRYGVNMYELYVVQ